VVVEGHNIDRLGQLARGHAVAFESIAASASSKAVDVVRLMLHAPPLPDRS
jgi:hypothetical protein